MHETERHILKKLLDANSQGVEDLFNLYYQRLCVFALKYVDSFQEAEDMVQETFILFWEQKKYRNIKTSLKAYLYTSVKNKALRKLETQKKIRFADIEDFAEKLIAPKRDKSSLDERIEKLNAEIEKLPPKSRKVFECIAIKGLKYKETAKLMDVSVNTVKTQFSRVLKKLRGSLDTIVWMIC